jgi:hypothetical protein
MQRKFLLSVSCVFLALLVIGYPGPNDGDRYPVMRPDPGTFQRWMIDYEAAPKALIDPNVDSFLYLAGIFDQGTSMDLLDDIDYDPTLRNQGRCGNCWVWAGTGVMEIAHNIQDAVFDRLSIQYFDSCRPGFACCGGNLGAFAAWYAGQGMAIPWDNTNAAFADGGRRCADGTLVACASIATVPNYPLISIQEVTIGTHNVGQATAINNIKNILNQNLAVYFSFALPDANSWDDFFDFWDGVGGETEATLCNIIDDYCGTEWDDNTAGAHAIVILGYNDDDPDPANHYWLALNSWGTAAGVRPNGLLRIPMQINYDCVYPDANNNQSFWGNGFQTLNVEFGNAVPVADAGGPYDVQCGGTTTAVPLDGSASLDLEGRPMTYSWATDCASASFDDPTSPTPTLTVNTSNGCSINCSVTLTVTDDAGSTDTDTASVAITDTVAPVIVCPPDITLECTGDCGVQASDPRLVPFFAGASATDLCDPSPQISNNAPAFFGMGPTEVTFTAQDDCGNISTCTANVTVVDTTAPQIGVKLNRYVLWPPSHKLIEINATVFVSDVCDPNAGFELTSITSNEPDNGLGDGDEPDDIQGAEFGTPDTTFQLRAERAGTGTGRIYTIVYTARDSCVPGSGNTETVTIYVHVPRSQRVQR